MYRSLAIKYRPKTFNEVVEQSTVIKILSKAVEQGKFKNAYLFAGPTGSGKTTIARIFANEINKGEGSPIEIDAASNNGVDNVRSIIESANERSLTSKYKIIILDEAHSITVQGWQAFLKTLEEPPAYTIFIFCTTEPNKIPQTILNRLQRFNISKISVDGIKNRLLYICQREGFTNYEETCDSISKNCHGCLRDAITNLDRCADLSTDLSMENTAGILDTQSYKTAFNLLWALRDKENYANVIKVIDDFDLAGEDISAFIDFLLDIALNLSTFICFGHDIKMTNLPAYLNTEDNPVINYTVDFDDSKTWFLSLIDTLLEIKLQIKYDTTKTNTVKAMLLRFMREVS